MKKLLISLTLILLISMFIGCAKEMTPTLTVPKTPVANALPTPPMGVPPGTAGATNDDIIFRQVGLPIEQMYIRRVNLTGRKSSKPKRRCGTLPALQVLRTVLIWKLKPGKPGTISFSSR